jgi:hypothetical protein
MKQYLIALLKMIVFICNLFLLAYVGMGLVFFYWEDLWPYNLIAIIVCLLSFPLQNKMMKWVFNINNI